MGEYVLQDTFITRAAIMSLAPSIHADYTNNDPVIVSLPCITHLQKGTLPGLYSLWSTAVRDAYEHARQHDETPQIIPSLDFLTVRLPMDNQEFQFRDQLRRMSGVIRFESS